MSKYNKNLTLLKNSSKMFYDIITKSREKYSVKIDTITGDKNFIVEKDNIRCFINSAYNIEREMEMTFKGIKKDTGVFIIFGIGSGYIIDYIKREFKNVEKVIFIEPCLEIMKVYLRNYDLQKVDKKFTKVEYIINESEDKIAPYFKETIAGSNSQGVVFVSQVAYRSLFRQYYNNLSKMVVKEINTALISVNTGNRNTYRLVANTIRNLNVKSVALSEKIHIFKNRPAIIVSAGPSLNKNMHLLKEVNNKAMIFAVGSSTKILESNGIIPHFRVAFSPHTQEIDIFKNLKRKDIPFIHTDMLYYKVNEIYDGPRFRMVSTTNYLAKYVYEKANIKQLKLHTSVSVANTTFELLCMAGCSEIILIGQDMAFTGMTNYAEGAVNNFDITGKESYTFIEKDIYGNDVVTKRPFMFIKEVFENAITRYKNKGIRFYNATEGGLPIDGTEIITLKEKLDNLNEMEDFKELYNEFKHINNDVDDNYSKIVEVFKKIMEDIIVIEKINGRRSERIKELINYRKEVKNVNKVLMEYMDINKFEDELKEQEFYSKVIMNGLRSLIDTIFMAYKYTGSNQLKQLNATENILVKSSLELKKYCKIFKALVKEGFGIDVNSENNEDSVNDNAKKEEIKA